MHFTIYCVLYSVLDFRLWRCVRFCAEFWDSCFGSFFWFFILVFVSWLTLYNLGSLVFNLQFVQSLL